MKKILILLVTMMLCACSPAEPMSLKDSYGQYKQEKIVYANKKDYIKKKDAYNANGIKLSEQMPKTSLISKSERSFYFFY